ncbi:uncharacterized protein LOC105213650 isoform X2 [Zeugodacus cucurbitae]|uniref:50S ribosomal protein L21 n=1 Tax=Zeugodacus cucurbitae TaxID=28588 RepID=A0A0A1WLW0_ZEUCU|nr:uncharacterized protein LOC105213650 isoform X2 [Zeugodacus cucurbitae]
MEKSLFWLDCTLFLLLTGVACASDVDQPFSIYMDVRKTLDDSVQIAKSCERKLSIMDSVLEMGRGPEMSLNSFENLENLTERINSYGLKQNALENTIQSLTSQSKETMNELRANISKVLSTVADLASKM